jgi:hypothetical protein
MVHVESISERSRCLWDKRLKYLAATFFLWAVVVTMRSLTVTTVAPLPRKGMAMLKAPFFVVWGVNSR